MKKLKLSKLANEEMSNKQLCAIKGGGACRDSSCRVDGGKVRRANRKVMGRE